MSKEVDKMIFRKAEKEDFYKIRSLYWNLIDQEKDDPSFPQWKKGIHPSDEMIQASIDKGLHRNTIPPRKKKPTVGQCEGRVAKQRKRLEQKNRISEIKEAHLVTIRLA